MCRNSLINLDLTYDWKNPRNLCGQNSSSSTAFAARFDPADLADRVYPLLEAPGGSISSSRRSATRLAPSFEDLFERDVTVVVGVEAGELDDTGVGELECRKPAVSIAVGI